MKIRRTHAAVAVVAAAALALSGCSSDDKGSGKNDDDNAGISTDAAVNIAWNQPFYSFNGNSTTGNATANSVILYLVNSHIYYYDADLNLVNDESFVKMEKISDDPLQVKYTFADTASWSDGTPATPADLLLEWAAQSGVFNTVEPEEDDEGEITNQDELDAGVFFNAADPAVALVKDTPVIEDNAITLTYSKPFADWEPAIDVGLPAHIVAKRALGIDDPAEAATALADAVTNKDTDDLSKIAKVWNDDFNYTELPSDADLYVSSGAYVMSEFKKDNFLTLKANEEYEGDHKASIPTVTVRYNGDPMGQVQALENGEVDLISPQSSADVLQALDAVSGVEVETSVEGTYEHIDLQFTNGGPFDPETYDGDADKALKVRQAFLKTIPRQEIVDKLMKPLNPDAAIRNSFSVVPGSPDYDAVSEASGQAAYDEVDIDGAKALLAEAGADSVKVRVLFDPSNTRRVNEFDLIAASAKEAGIEAVPYEVQEDWGTDLDTAQSYYDAALFGWQSTSTAVTESDANYRTDATNNFFGYSNGSVDSLFDELQGETDPDRQVEILGEVEKHLVDDAFGLTLYQFPGISAWRETSISNVVPLTIAPAIFYGFWDWSAGTGE